MFSCFSGCRIKKKANALFNALGLSIDDLALTGKLPTLYPRLQCRWDSDKDLYTSVITEYCSEDKDHRDVGY